ncbi:MAG: hypothetical protein K5798_08280 [Nitrosopumilus sp.]|uniref:hypothetical protein n=1 Tax=Nitrosopumilus sp. TaxID=2024843 RepID=UPI00242FBE1A|nr:hypothetical protein [Nitrosopumilus sp.]MCV0367239.1 hypothetical protein [Nitrosopumilus sp.]
MIKLRSFGLYNNHDPYYVGFLTRWQLSYLKFHFLKVSNDGKGDCTIVELPDDTLMVIDIKNARIGQAPLTDCENPIEYLQNIPNSNSIHRYIQTHPDMDHLDGFSDFLTDRSIVNFWDTDNNKTIDEFTNYREDDWTTYTKKKNLGKILHLDRRTNEITYSDGQKYDYQIFPISPTEDLVQQANDAKSDCYNLLSYVVLLRYKNCKILFGGDAPESVWNEIETWIDENDDARELFSNITIFKTSHHGRDSGYCGNSFLQKINPSAIIADNNVSSEESAYDKYKKFLENRSPSGLMFDIGRETVFGKYDTVNGTIIDYKTNW